MKILLAFHHVVNEDNHVVNKNKIHKPVTPTQQTVADLAGVSRETVSQILGGRTADRYNEETRRKVEEAASQLGYRPNRAARLIRGGKSGIIAVVNFGHSALQQKKVSQAVRSILEEGYEPVVYDVLWFADTGAGVCQRLLESHVEGVLLVHPTLRFTQKSLDQLLRAEIPVVAMGGSQLKGIVNYMSDKHQGFHDLTRYLLDMGYRRLLFLGNVEAGHRRYMKRCWHTRHAIQGIEEAIREYGTGYCAIELFSGQVKQDSQGFTKGKEAMQEVLKKGCLPEVVMCSNDAWAIGALTACAEADVRVPQDMAITGFENDPIGEVGLLPLTTMAHPGEEMAKCAVDSLFKQVRGQTKVDPLLHVLPCKLIVRRSCGAYLKKTSVSPALVCE